MKNNIFFVLMLAAIMAGSFFPQTYAMEKRPSIKKIASAKQTSTISKITGRVTGCNLQNSTLSVSTNTGTSLVIKINKNTSLTRGVKNIKLADIKSGDTITVSYKTKKGANIAKSINIPKKITPASVPMKSKK